MTRAGLHPRFMNCIECQGDIGTADKCIWCGASQDVS